MSYNKELLYKEFKDINPKHIEAALNLLGEGNTIPFIARYRKEMTGSLDEVVIQEIAKKDAYLDTLHIRKEDIIRLIDEQGKLTEAIQSAVLNADTLAKLEDIYRPYKPKKKTKATVAKEKGLEPLALDIINFNGSYDFKAYINKEKDIETIEDVKEGVHEIITENIGDEPIHRDKIRFFFNKYGKFMVEVKDQTIDEKGIYKMYYDFSTNINMLKPHQILAINRGEKEGILKVKIEIDTDLVESYFHKALIEDEDSIAVEFIVKAYKDSYKRFIKPAIEREIRNGLTEKADIQAISVFGENLKNLLLQAPLKGKTVLGFDPAYRTGCKLAIVNENGSLLDIAVIYPHDPASNQQKLQAKETLINLINKHNVDIIAIGNGTASRESEQFVGLILKELNREVSYLIVNEAGASVYSASENARKEFPDLEVEKRSAISIARRIQDPLAELVKIEPKAIGVGQYQHDVSQKELNQTLKFVVETAVNGVGVDLNTASVELLSFVSGLNATLSNNIIKLRNKIGGFKNRKELLEVPRMGPKSYEQAVGFLRIPRGENILDNTSIHPENYKLVNKILKDYDISLENITDYHDNIKAWNIEDMSSRYNIGRETLTDIQQALLKPGRDMRDDATQPLLRTDVLTLEDLKPRMKLQGTVRNVVDFGAFVDIGVKQEGLVHLSKLSDKFVKHPKDIVKVGDIVTVWVSEVDLQRQRIQLTMINEG